MATQTCNDCKHVKEVVSLLPFKVIESAAANLCRIGGVAMVAGMCFYYLREGKAYESYLEQKKELMLRLVEGKPNSGRRTSNSIPILKN